MRVLYLPGLEHDPSAERMAQLQRRGHLVQQPEGSYRREPRYFEQLERLAKQEQPDCIVGHGVGGYFGYWLGHALRIDQLLFNPAMPYRNVKVQRLDIDERREITSRIVLGAQDEVILPRLNLDFFAGKPHAHVVTCHWLGHFIDEQTFEEMLNWAGL